MNQDIASRIPSYPNMGTYHILFMQYNLFVYIMVVAFVFTIICIVLICMLTYINKYRKYLIEKVLPNFLSKYSTYQVSP